MSAADGAVTSLPRGGFEPLADVHLDDPYPAYREARERSSVHRDAAGRWFVLGYRDVSRLLADPGCPHWDDAAAPGRNYVGAAVKRYAQESPPAYRRGARRSLRRRAGSAAPELTALASAQADGVARELAEGGAVDLMERYVRPYMFEAACRTLGIPEALRPRAQLAVEAYPDPLPTLLPVAQTRRTAGLAANVLIATLEKTLAHRRSERGDDLASVAWEAGERPGGIAEVDQLLFSLYAAFETGAGFLGNAIYALLTHPTELERARADLDSRAVHELLRFDGPIQFIRVGTRRPLALGDHEIPGAAEVYLAVAAANRDPDLCPDPDHLDLHREVTRHLAFGRGPLRCVGANLGALQARIALQVLLAALPSLELDPENPPRWKREAVLMRGPRRLHVRLALGA